MHRDMILRLFVQRSTRRKCVIVNGRMNQSIVTKIAEYFATKPVVRAYIFGSFARGENGPDSDIDILVTFDRSAKVSLFDHVTMTYDLEDLLGMEVDLVTEGTLLPRVAASADNDKVLVYERAS